MGPLATGREHRRPATWPMIILRTPKGWTGPKEVDGLPVKGTFRAHQVPLSGLAPTRSIRDAGELDAGYRPEELFDESGMLMPELAALAPEGDRRMSANPHANGGSCSGIWPCRTSATMPSQVHGPATELGRPRR